MPAVAMATLMQAADSKPWYGPVPVRWRQASVRGAFCKLLSQEMTEDMQFPLLEGLSNQAPCTIYLDFIDTLGFESDRSMGPDIITSYSEGWRNLATQQQKGHFFTKEVF